MNTRLTPERNKPTKVGHATRIEHAALLLSKYRFKSRVKRELIEAYKISKWTAERYIQHGRKLLMQLNDLDFDTLKAQSYSTYKEILEDPLATNMEKIQAQKAIDDLFGLRPPKVVHSHIRGKVTVGLQEMLEKPEIQDVIRERSNRNGNLRLHTNN